MREPRKQRYAGKDQEANIQPHDRRGDSLLPLPGLKRWWKESRGRKSKPNSE